MLKSCKNKTNELEILESNLDLGAWKIFAIFFLLEKKVINNN